jgi:hypothetical protein
MLENAIRRNRSKRAARKPPNGSWPAACAACLATLTIVAAWIDDRDIPERSDAGVAFGIFLSPTVGASRFSPSLPLPLAPAAKRSTPLFFCELEELFLPLAKPLANAKGLAACLSPSLAAIHCFYRRPARGLPRGRATAARAISSARLISASPRRPQLPQRRVEIAAGRCA